MEHRAAFAASKSLRANLDTPTPSPTDTPTPEPEESPSPTPTPDPELEQIERAARLATARKTLAEAEKAEAEARKDKAEAEQTLTKTKLGIGAAQATATPPSGNISAGETPKYIETQLLAEAGARMASLELISHMCNTPAPDLTPSPVAALKENPIKTLVINNPPDKAAISHYRAIVGQLQFLTDHYNKLIKQSVDARDDAIAEAAALPLLIPAATQAVKNVADLVNLFRTETEFKNQDVAINARLIVSSFTNNLLSMDTQQCKVKAIYQPGVYPLSIPKDVKSGSLLRTYQQLLDAVTRGDNEVNENKKKVAELTEAKSELEATLADLKKQLEKLRSDTKGDQEKPAANQPAASAQSPEAQKLERDIKSGQQFVGKLARRINRLNQAAANLEAAKTNLTGLLALLTTVDDATKQPVLVNLVSAERLSDILAAKDTYVLDLSVKASGTNRIRRNMFFNAKLAHTGGVSIDANLYNSQDELVFGRLEDYYIEFTGSEDIRKRMGFRKLNNLRR